MPSSLPWCALVVTTGVLGSAVVGCGGASHPATPEPVEQMQVAVVTPVPAEPAPANPARVVAAGLVAALISRAVGETMILAVAAGMQPIDPKAIQEFVKRNADQEDAEQQGLGYTWATCSMLSPERRVMEPACDGLMLQRVPGDETGVAALMAPDKETLRAIKAYAPEKLPAINPEGDAAKDRTWRNESDDYYGKKPWE